MLDFFRNRKHKLNEFQEAVRARKNKSKPLEIPDGIIGYCSQCGVNHLISDVKDNDFVCLNCQFHLRIDAKTRINLTVDENTFVEMFKTDDIPDPLSMPGYHEKCTSLKKNGIFEAVIVGVGDISSYKWAIAAMDSTFLMGSMGSVVGEKLVKLIEYATENRLPLLIFATSGGARMQEGIFSLMQMAKTTAALTKHNDAGLFYLSVLTDPTFGGVSASFATVADVILAEPEAIIGFAGPRVIKQTIKQVLPAGFQSSEFLHEHGLIDKIVHRRDMKQTITLLSSLFTVKGEKKHDKTA